MKEETLKNIVAEWLEERKLPELFERDMPPVDLAGLTSILAIVGPRRAGKTFYMFQLIRELEKTGTAREDILFIDLEDYRLADFNPSEIDRIVESVSGVPGVEKVVSLPALRRFKIDASFQF